MRWQWVVADMSRHHDPSNHANQGNETGGPYGPTAHPGINPHLANANVYGMDPVASGSAFDTGLMLGFEQPPPAAPGVPQDQMSITDPLIQTL